MQQQKQKKIPVRRCVGCNAQRPKRELVRVVRSPEGEISIDLRGKAPGRGAYLCPSASLIVYGMMVFLVYSLFFSVYFCFIIFL